MDNAKIQKIFLNGRKAYQLYQRYMFPVTGREGICLPSTSPANAAWSIDRLTEAWRGIKNEKEHKNSNSNYVMWRYDGTAKAAVAIARIAGSWDPSNLEENLSKWDLFVAVDENGEIPAPEMFPENPEFVGSTLDYGDNYQFADGERVYNELETEFYEYVGNFRATGDTFASLEWKPVDEML